MVNTAILVLSGRGKVGGRVVRHLEDRGVPARAASRSGRTRFDWDDESTWGPALAGASAAFLVSLEDQDTGERMGRLSELAVAEGVRRLVLLSARIPPGADVPPILIPEQAVKGSGVEWTIIRPGWFDQNFSENAVFKEGLLAGELGTATGDGQEPFIDAEDIAEVAAVLLTEDGHAGQLYELSGPRLLTFADAVEEISRAAGRTIRHVKVAPEEYVEYAVSRGADEAMARRLGGLYHPVREGLNARLSDGVQRVLGREPRDFGDYAARTASVWAADRR